MTDEKPLIDSDAQVIERSFGAADRPVTMQPPTSTASPEQTTVEPPEPAGKKGDD